MPVWGQTLFGVAFFFALLIAGLSTSISMMEAFTSAVIDRTGTRRKTVLGWLTGVGLWWDVTVKNITRALLGDNIVTNRIEELGEPYGGYSRPAIILFGWTVAVGMVAASVYPSRRPDHSEMLQYAAGYCCTAASPR